VTSLRHQAYIINRVDDPAAVDPVVDNVDVIVHFEDGSRYAATFFTLANLRRIQEQYRETGECENGLYFWASRMIVIESLTWTNVESAISDLIKSGEFEGAFEGPLPD
jgi:hypothetical protein